MLEKTNTHIFLLLFMTIMLCVPQMGSCYSWKSDWELWDLEYNDDRFVDEVNAWSATSLVTSGVKYSLCNGAYLMGGYNILGGVSNEYWERTFTGLPPHNQLNLIYMVYPVDSWDGDRTDDHYEVYVDGYTQRCWNFSYYTGYAVETCGNGGYPEFPPVLAKSSFPHSGSSVTIRFINMLDQPSYDESLGIREIKMKFINVTTPTLSLCGRSTASKPLPSQPCEACDSSHEYMSVPSSGTCYECAASCETCNATGCTSCYTGNYTDGTSCKQCDSSCATCVTSANYCLTCQAGLFMASNSCYSTCSYPLYSTESEGISHCNSPCSGSDYVMWDGSCSPTCSADLNATKISSFPVCTFPCSITPISL